MGRVAAFIKRLLLTALGLQPHQMLSVLALVRSLLHRYYKLQQLLESDVNRVALGEYRADVDEPDSTNSYSTACESGAPLPPTARSVRTDHISARSELPNETPRALLDAYDPTGLHFAPRVTVPPRNPLFAQMAPHAKRKQIKKRQRQRKFFVSDPTQEKAWRASPCIPMCLQCGRAGPQNSEHSDCC
jgi:nucleolar complex protein 3